MTIFKFNTIFIILIISCIHNALVSKTNLKIQTKSTLLLSNNHNINTIPKQENKEPKSK